LVLETKFAPEYAMAVSFKTYEQLALEDTDEMWELVCGRLRTKPGMTAQHNMLGRKLPYYLNQQLDLTRYWAGENVKVRVSDNTYYITDVVVVPLTFWRQQVEQHPRGLEVYEEPLPLVVEIWSPSTGKYDAETKVPEFQLRGDAEIWRIQPYEHTLTAWRRQPDGSYTETLYRQGQVPVLSLPGIAIDLAELFD
jgi:Uma2 family endonuclease